MQTPTSAPASPAAPAAAPQPGTPEYDQAMIAKFESHQPRATPTTPSSTEAPTTPAKRPDDVPEKFWDAEKGQVKTEALLKSYSELERARSQPTPQTPPASAPAEQAAVTEAKAKADTARTAFDAALAKLTANPQDSTAAAELAAAKSALDTADAAYKATSEAAAKPSQQPEQVDFDALEDEYADNGALSEASYEKLAKAGYSKAHVDQYIEGRLAVADKLVGEVHSLFGGEAEFAKVREWAKANVPAADREAISKALVEGTPAQMKLAAEALKSRYEAANGKAPVLEQGGDTNLPANSGFASRAEMVAAMRDPRYAKDENYRAWVEARAAASTTF